ncbi:class I SAM-dependent methyltransferase [Variovorax sp. J22R24]|uniref:class I SAM-dependent methyltransferase n=1 Tax=Variovorax gracilis TaxID=3053502 RepID=UPI0025762461|nr:class I SAM-dependent methyltransferase [Variovorax sp. J22R24]MDM0105010.1 class I SAM-dependent methyltransferase [Variovorax sp. J22R24]
MANYLRDISKFLMPHGIVRAYQLRREKRDLVAAIQAERTSASASEAAANNALEDAKNKLREETERALGEAKRAADEIERRDKVIREFEQKMAYVPPPKLTEEHLRGAQLFSDRFTMIEGLSLPRENPIIGEVGVALGTFTDVMIQKFRPSRFVAFDTYNLHASPLIWGEPSSVLLKGMTHLDFYKDRFAAQGDVMTYEVGDCHETLAAYPDETFDLIYIDAGHEYADVKLDSINAARKLKPDGIIIFNDYVVFDHFANIHYGVVRAANELIVQDNWRVVGLALHSEMFCDLAVTRASA